MGKYTTVLTLNLAPFTRESGRTVKKKARASSSTKMEANTEANSRMGKKADTAFTIIQTETATLARGKRINDTGKVLTVSLYASQSIPAHGPRVRWQKEHGNCMTRPHKKSHVDIS